MTKKIALYFGLASALVGTLWVVVAAPVFTPNNQPWGYVAPPTLSTNDVAPGTAIAYAPWFEVGAFQGDIYAYPVASSGEIDVLAPLWNARAAVDLQDFSTGRNIITTRDGAGIPFRWPNLSNAQKNDIESAASGDASSDVLDFIRGDRSNEVQNGGDLRKRLSVIGDIVHSPPVFVGAPNFPYNFDNYVSFATGVAASRGKRIYVGANDGMLHSYDADTGQEMFGFIPSMVVPNLTLLKEYPYAHQYYVDGVVSVVDAYNGSNWKTILVGGLGAGGRGFYAMDVTAPTDLTASETDVAAKVLWEYNTDTPVTGSLLGYSYSRPSIVRLNSGGADKDWGVIVGNGYLSSGGGASLHIRDVFDGSEISTLAAGTPSVTDPNGLSSPTVGDLDGNGTADVVFAGDLNGNLWKFDIADSNPANWTSSLFFMATDAFGTAQSIVAAPELAYHPSLGIMVYIATGRMFTTVDAQNTQIQSVYGLRVSSGPHLAPTLMSQTLSSHIHTAGPVRTSTDNQITSEDGWKVDLPQYENVIQDLVVRDARVQFVSVNASFETGENWLYELDYGSGGSPGYTVLDVNDDKSLTEADNFDGNTNGSLVDAEDVVIAQQQHFGLASRPNIVSKGVSADVAIINHLAAISPAEVPPPVAFGEDLGLIGGHFDLDTTGTAGTHDWGDGDTHEHDHEWDDKTGRATVDFFEIVECGDPLDQDSCSSDDDHLEIHDSVGAGTPFHILVSNAEMSPGAVMNFNGISVAATDYQAQIEAALGGVGALPTFTLNGTSGVQMNDLSVSFGAKAIITGGLVPTATGCVRGNDPGKFNEYRNGAFTVQAVSTGGFPAQVNDTTGPGGAPIRGGKGSGLVNHIGGGNPALLWEATLFWHWDGGCYGESSWDERYQECIASGNIETCFNVCMPGRRNWTFRFSGDVEPGGDWATIGDMTITLTATNGSTTSLTFNDQNVHERTPNENVMFGSPGVAIDLSNSVLDGDTLSNIGILNIVGSNATIYSVTVDWTGASTMSVEPIVDETTNYGIDPLSQEGISHAKGAEIRIGDFVLESSLAQFCTVNTGFDGEIDDFNGSQSCNEEVLTYKFARVLTEALVPTGESAYIEAQMKKNATGVYYWTVDFTADGDSKQVILNVINGTTIGSITGDTGWLEPEASMTVNNKKMGNTFTNVGNSTVVITDLTVAFVGAPGGQAVSKVRSNNALVHNGPDTGSNVPIAFSTPQSLLSATTTTLGPAGPDFGLSYDVKSGTAGLGDLYPSEYPTYDTGTHTGNATAAAEMGIDGNPAVILSTVGNNLVMKLSNTTDDKLKITVEDISWSGADPQQQFLELVDSEGNVISNKASNTGSNVVHNIDKKVELAGSSCQEASDTDSGKDDKKGGGGDDKDDKDDKDDTDTDPGKGGDDDSPPVETGDETDPGGSLSDTTQAGGSAGSTGRLKWREIVF